LSMSKNYKQLSLEQRYQIECLIKAGPRCRGRAVRDLLVNVCFYLLPTPRPPS
jgi:hypothetical protein